MNYFIKGFILIVLGCLLVYFNLPVLNYGFVELPFLLLILVFVWMILSTKLQISRDGKQVKMINLPSSIWLYIIGILLVYIFIFPIFSSRLIQTEKHQELIGKVSNGDKISKHIAPISLNEIRVVDEDLAYLLGEKILGSQPALGSQVHLGEFYIQKINNKLYWVAPLLHSGFFKWLNNTEGTDGYVMVSATNERDVQLVQNNSGKSIKIKYQPSAYLGDEIRRHIYFNGYTSTGLTDFTFEVDDTGKPFWVVTKYDKKIGFTGNDATGVLVVDAQTGIIKEYAITNTPQWVDRIQPIGFIEDQLNDWGEFVHGYWNFSNADKLKITEGMSLVYGKDNKSYWYTGLTSVGKDESSVGFVLVDTRTKQATFYKQSGATEFAAQNSAQGKVQEKGYNASLPIPYNINNIPTYVMTLKDRGGLVKMFAMVSIHDYTIVGVGNTMRETLMAYKNAYNMSGDGIKLETATDKKTVKSVVTRIQNDVKNGNSFYYFTIQGENKIFIGSSQLSNQLPITHVGDQVEITYDTDTEEVIDVSNFKNLSLEK
ncbi:hypothetical protein AX766_03485 [Flavobacterium covae]|uniref:Cell shape-determining protein n=1 Tax=Flavobacterium covae TaxID=2906076 RepID=A0ABW8PFQ2_9FLAO|nr:MULTISPECIES: hypothetical protein [Flavobacterium]AND63532.1 hypothetical protein AX766_03485 [Flavobacterium covae]MCJ1806653.1 hypothetical protein [Flavobacterium covae]OWP82254.1 hypothetical protein BWK63_02065 [Flavobacterium covae]POR22444.1 hypothetical protein BWK57_06060 [Flavobacterium columnare]